MIQVALAEVDIPSFESITGEAKQAVLSSKILAGEVGKLCTALKDLVEPAEEPEQKDSSGEEDEVEWKGIGANQDDDDDEDEGDIPDSAALESALKKLGIPLDSVPHDTQSDSPSEIDSVVLDDGEESEDVDDGASWESGSVDSEGNIRHAVSPSGSSTGSSPPPKKQTKTTSKTESRFLPSLAAGFIRGDSDGSDIEDADVAPERKNRRGQRARKAIWEKKYGKNANHVKKAREEVAARGRGRGRGRGGFASRVGRGAPLAMDGQGGRPGLSRGAPTGRGGRVRPPPAPLPTTRDSGWQQRPPKKEKDEKPIHPSWIAKQKLKSKESIAAAPQGKKIVFD
ncbi:BUD22 family protein C4F10,06 [Rhizoctonia solani AG-1 IB]|nr:BUD22 family protein C4F10,06 [Rhizoctonia solani AG-1 IB]